MSDRQDKGGAVIIVVLLAYSAKSFSILAAECGYGVVVGLGGGWRVGLSSWEGGVVAGGLSHIITVPKDYYLPWIVWSCIIFSQQVRGA